MYALRLRAPSPARVALPTPIIDSEAQAAEAAAMAEAEEQSLQALFPVLAASPEDARVGGRVHWTLCGTAESEIHSRTETHAMED